MAKMVVSGGKASDDPASHALHFKVIKRWCCNILGFSNTYLGFWFVCRQTVIQRGQKSPDSRSFESFVDVGARTRPEAERALLAAC